MAEYVEILRVKSIFLLVILLTIYSSLTYSLTSLSYFDFHNESNICIDSTVSFKFFIII